MSHPRSTLILALGLLTVVPAAATAAGGPQPPNCTLYAPMGAAEHPLTLPGGEKVVARDPYGGLMARNRLFFDFSVVKPDRGGSPTGIAQVTWALDGKVVRTDATAPFEWKGLSGSDRRMPAGDHQITVAVTPTGGGTPVSTSFALTATDCQPAGMFADLDAPRTHSSYLDAYSAFESDDGPTMRSVTFRGTGVTARIAASARGRAAGTADARPRADLSAARAAKGRHAAEPRFDAGRAASRRAAVPHGQRSAEWRARGLVAARQAADRAPWLPLRRKCGHRRRGRERAGRRGRREQLLGRGSEGVSSRRLLSRGRRPRGRGLRK